jgi:nucleotide-binding universal stress UspA family protein
MAICDAMTDSRIHSQRRKFLVVVDKTPEHRVALRFAARRAGHTGGIVSLLTAIEPPDAQQWQSVQKLMLEEAYLEAERILHEAAQQIKGITGGMPEFVILEGNKRDALLALIRDDPAISILVLAAGTAGEGPGPLVAAVAGETGRGYPIPVTIVPGGLSDAEIDAIA